MKKYLLGVFAFSLAVGASAFSSKPEKFVNRFYLDSTGWHAIDASLTCPEGTKLNCIVDVNGTQRQIYKSQSTNDPLKYN